MDFIKKVTYKSKTDLLVLSLFLFSFNFSCASNITTVDSTKVTATTDKVKDNSIAFVTAGQLDENGIKPISQYKLPSDIDIKNVSVVEASLDGRDLNKDDISLGLDNNGNITFFISKSAFDTSFAGKSDETNLSIYSSDTFEKKKQELRTELLQKYKDTLRDDTDTQIATPDFLKVKTRGDVLTRVQVASLKKDASKLAKENLFIDRNLYIVLQVGNDKFSVKADSQPKIIINKFNIGGSEIKNIIDLQNNGNNSSKIYALPVIAEKISKNDSGFFENISDLNQSKKVIEAEEIEKSLSLEIGQEVSKTTKNLNEIYLGLDMNDIKAIEAKKPELAVDSTISEKKDDSLDVSIEKAKQNEKDLAADFQKVGHKPIPDSRLFDPNKVIEDIFKDFDNQPAQSKFTYNTTQESISLPSNATPEQQNLMNKELDYPYPGNILIELDKQFSDILKDYTLAALTNGNTIFPVSTYIIKNGYLVMDVHTYKSLKQLKLYMLDKNDNGVLLTITSDQYFDFDYNTPKPGTSQNQSSVSTPKDQVQKVDDNAAAQGKPVTSIDNGPPKPVSFTQAPRIINVDPKNLKFELFKNTKLSNDELKKLNVYEEIFVSPSGEQPPITNNSPCGMPQNGMNNPPPPNGQYPPPPPNGQQGQNPPPPPNGQNPPPQQQQMNNPCPPPNGSVQTTNSNNQSKKTFLHMPKDKEGNSQGYLIISDSGAIIGFIAEKDFVNDGNSIILEGDK